MASERQIGHVRYTIVAMLFFATAINYADRATLSIAGPALAHDLALNPLQMGFVFSAFGWSYVLAQLPGGFLLDKFGSKRVYFFSILAWSIFTFMQGGVHLLPTTAALASLFALRFLVGIAEAPAFPGNARIVATWFPASERGTASAIFNSAQYFATVLFAPIMGWITFTYGWPWCSTSWAAWDVCSASPGCGSFNPPEHPNLPRARARVHRTRRCHGRHRHTCAYGRRRLYYRI